jgi:SET domain-containing protein
MFEIRRSGIQGRGAFATRKIRKGTRIIEYTGERISSAEGDRRYDDDKMSRHHTFLFCLDAKTVVDAAVGGNDARFINHSCDPNCEAVIEKRRIYIDALRTIQPGEELAYDYAYDRTSDHTEEDEKLYVCHCGAEGCRGTILAPPKPKRRRKSAKKAAKRGTRAKGSSRKKRAR